MPFRPVVFTEWVRRGRRRWFGPVAWIVPTSGGRQAALPRCGARRHRLPA